MKNLDFEIFVKRKERERESRIFLFSLNYDGWLF